MTTAAATTPAVALAERDDSELLALIRADDEDDELRTAALSHLEYVEAAYKREIPQANPT